MFPIYAEGQELDGTRSYEVSTPVRRSWNSSLAKPLAYRSRTALKRLARQEGLALLICPGRELCIAADAAKRWRREKVGMAKNKRRRSPSGTSFQVGAATPMSGSCRFCRIRHEDSLIPGAGEIMRGIYIVAIAVIAGCSSYDSTGPWASQPSVTSIKIEGPETILASDSVRLTVSLLDASARPLSNRPITFASSDPLIATVDATGNVRAVAEGSVVITVSSGSAWARKSMAVLPRRRCSTQSPECVASAERYVLVLVNDSALPVKSPWGAGEWDYDSDAGTWMTTHAEMLLFSDGYYTYFTFHRAASGRTSSFSFGGHYERGSGSVEFYPDGSLSSSATVTENGLVERWAGGLTLVYQRYASPATVVQ